MGFYLNKIVIKKMKCLHEIRGHSDNIWDVKWSPDGKHLASCGSDKSVWIWGIQDGKWTCKNLLQDGHQRTIRKIEWSPCGNLIASASFDSTICIWDKRSGAFESCATLEGHDNEVKCVKWSNCGQYIASCSRDRSVWIWSVEEDNDFECAGMLTDHKQDVKHVCWHPNLDVLASASYDDTIKIHVSRNYEWESVTTLYGHESTVWSVCWSKDGDRLVSCSDDNTVRVWQSYKADGYSKGADVTNENTVWKSVCTLSGYHTRTVYCVDWNADDVIASGGGDNTINIFREEETQEPLQANFAAVARQHQAHDQDVNAVAWNPQNGHLLASCSDDEIIKIWDVNSA